METKKELSDAEFSIAEREMLRRFSQAANHFAAFCQALTVVGIEGELFQKVLDKHGLGVNNPKATSESEKSAPPSGSSSPESTPQALHS